MAAMPSAPLIMSTNYRQQIDTNLKRIFRSMSTVADPNLRYPDYG